MIQRLYTICVKNRTLSLNFFSSKSSCTFQFMLILEMVPVTQPLWLLHSLVPVPQENGTSRLLKYHAQQPTRKFLWLPTQCKEVRFASFLSGGIYYYGSNKSTGQETGKMHLFAVKVLASMTACYWGQGLETQVHSWHTGYCQRLFTKGS